jgi:hypothetical protein
LPGGFSTIENETDLAVIKGTTAGRINRRI